jgi:hypothetical protein
MKWCCQGFQASYGQRHERGPFVYVLPPVTGATTEPSFHIGFRALERSRHASFSEAVKGRMDGCMSLDGRPTGSPLARRPHGIPLSLGGDSGESGRQNHAMQQTRDSVLRYG